MVVLDEVGLAEDSPNLPLKALHPLLEDGTEGTGVNNGDFTDKVRKIICICFMPFWCENEVWNMIHIHFYSRLSIAQRGLPLLAYLTGLWIQLR